MNEEILSEIRSAFVWEGNACSSQIEEGDKIHIYVTGWSTVEHDGDVRGIEDQVRELVGQTWKDEKFKYSCLSASCDTKTDGEGHDEDYSCTAHGVVILKKEDI